MNQSTPVNDSQRTIMTEDVFTFSGSRLDYHGKRTVKRYERDPSKNWIGNSRWHIDLRDFTVAFDGEDEQIGTIFSVDPSALIHTTLVTLGEKTPDGHKVLTPTATWFELCNQLVTDPIFRFEFCASPVKFEHFLAGAQRLSTWDSVILTPRSADRGRDVICTKGGQRLLEDAKANGPTKLVKAELVRALYGVLKLDDDATKAIITTTADFAPRVADEFSKLSSDVFETRNGEQLVDSVGRIAVTQQAVQAAATLYSQAGVEIAVDVRGRVVPQRKLVSLTELRESR
jgi:restriction system protein